MSILLVGGGRMGQALLGGWLKTSAIDRIAVVEPEPTAELLALVDGRRVTLGPSVTQGRGDLPAPLTVVMAIKPQMMDQAAPLYALDGPNVLYLSIAAGKTLGRLADYWGPQASIIRAMPNLPAQIGRGISVAMANQNAGRLAQAQAQALLEAVGTVEWVEDEPLIDAVTAVSGSGPAYVFLLAEALAAAGAKAGLDPMMAQRLARATLEGAAEMLHQSNAAPSALRQAVTSPKGTTAAALDILMGTEGLEDLMTRAVAAATRRSRELAD